MIGLWGGTTAGALRVQLAAVQRKRSSRRVFGSVRPTARMHTARTKKICGRYGFSPNIRARSARRKILRCVTVRYRYSPPRYAPLAHIRPPLRIFVLSAICTHVRPHTYAVNEHVIHYLTQRKRGLIFPKRKISIVSVGRLGEPRWRLPPC